MRRLRAASALVLMAFFAVAGAYHHHRLPRPTHDHAGLCSNTSTVTSLESCAICQATHSVAERLAVVPVAGGLDPSTPLIVTSELAPSPLNASLLHGSRAPPSA